MSSRNLGEVALELDGPISSVSRAIVEENQINGAILPFYLDCSRSNAFRACDNWAGFLDWLIEFGECDAGHAGVIGFILYCTKRDRMCSGRGIYLADGESYRTKDSLAVEVHWVTHGLSVHNCMNMC